MQIVDQINSRARKVPTWPVYLIGAAPLPWLFYQGLTGALGVEPIKALEHEYGELALILLIAGLCITPLRRYAGINLLKFRRALGLLAFLYVVAHLLVWAVLDVQAFDRVWADILKRPYITIGMLGFILMTPLALTSNTFSIRRLGARWRKLHRLTYVVALLGAVHFMLVVKGVPIEPIPYLLAILALLAVRLPKRRTKLA